MASSQVMSNLLHRCITRWRSRRSRKSIQRSTSTKEQSRPHDVENIEEPEARRDFHGLLDHQHDRSVDGNFRKNLAVMEDRGSPDVREAYRDDVYWNSVMHSKRNSPGDNFTSTPQKPSSLQKSSREDTNATKVATRTNSVRLPDRPIVTQFPHYADKPLPPLPAVSEDFSPSGTLLMDAYLESTSPYPESLTSPTLPISSPPKSKRYSYSLFPSPTKPHNAPPPSSLLERRNSARSVSCASDTPFSTARPICVYKNDQGEGRRIRLDDEDGDESEDSLYAWPKKVKKVKQSLPNGIEPREASIVNGGYGITSSPTEISTKNSVETEKSTAENNSKAHSGSPGTKAKGKGKEKEKESVRCVPNFSNPSSNEWWPAHDGMGTGGEYETLDDVTELESLHQAPRIYHYPPPPSVHSCSEEEADSAHGVEYARKLWQNFKHEETADHPPQDMNFVIPCPSAHSKVEHYVPCTSGHRLITPTLRTVHQEDPTARSRHQLPYPRLSSDIIFELGSLWSAIDKAMTLFRSSWERNDALIDMIRDIQGRIYVVLEGEEIPVQSQSDLPHYSSRSPDKDIESQHTTRSFFLGQARLLSSLLPKAKRKTTGPGRARDKSKSKTKDNHKHHRASCAMETRPPPPFSSRNSPPVPTGGPNILRTASHAPPYASTIHTWTPRPSSISSLQSPYPWCPRSHNSSPYANPQRPSFSPCCCSHHAISQKHDTHESDLRRVENDLEHLHFVAQQNRKKFEEDLVDWGKLIEDAQTLREARDADREM